MMLRQSRFVFMLLAVASWQFLSVVTAESVQSGSPEAPAASSTSPISVLPDYETPKSPHPFHSAESLASDPHISHFPSVQIEHRSAIAQLKDYEHDRDVLKQLRKLNLVDPATKPIQDTDANDPDAARIEKQYDTATLEFFASASSTLSKVFQNDADAIFHYKSMVHRAKKLLRERNYDQAATLFQEAAHFYFSAVKAPYAKIASSKALGQTIETRIETQLSKERDAQPVNKDGTSVGNSVAQQFRQKELDNRPHVHNALKEYQKSLTQPPKATKKQENKQTENKAEKTN